MARFLDWVSCSLAARDCPLVGVLGGWADSRFVLPTLVRARDKVPCWMAMGDSLPPPTTNWMTLKSTVSYPTHFRTCTHTFSMDTRWRAWLTHQCQCQCQIKHRMFNNFLHFISRTIIFIKSTLDN